MENAGQTLVIISIGVIFASWVAASYKNGLLYSPQSSVSKKGQVKYEVDKTKIDKFISYMVLAFAMSSICGLIITREIVAVLIFDVLNMVGIAYFLTYWMLFKEKKNSKK